MFAGLNIKFDDAVSLPSTHATDEMDRISTVSVSQKNRVGTKKERMKKRRDELLMSKMFITKLLHFGEGRSGMLYKHCNYSIITYRKCISTGISKTKF